MEKLSTLAKKIKISSEYGAVPWSRVQAADDGDKTRWHQTAHNYRVTLTYQRRRLTVDWYQGQLITRDPDAGSVIGALLMDAQAGEMEFSEFASDLGYDEDSRKAERIWKATRALAPKLRRLLGDDFDTFNETLSA